MITVVPFVMIQVTCARYTTMGIVRPMVALIHLLLLFVMTSFHAPPTHVIHPQDASSLIHAMTTWTAPPILAL